MRLRARPRAGRRSGKQDAAGDLGAGFEDEEFFAGDKSEDGIGCGFGELDKVAVDAEWVAVEASEFNHGAASS